MWVDSLTAQTDAIIYIWRSASTRHRILTNMKHIAALILPLFYLAATHGALLAQQAPQYSLFALNPYAYNPAFAGLDNTLVATGVYRRQWSGLEGAPETQHINAHLPIYRLSSGVGLKIENDIVGAHRTTQGSVSYAYHIEVGRRTQLSMALGAGILQYSLDGDKLRTPQGTYTGGAISHNDPNLPDGSVSATTPTFETGLYLRSGGLEAGFSVQPVFAPLLTAPSTDRRNSFSIKAVPHYLLQVAYVMALGDDLSIRPAALAKSDGVQTQAEFSVIFRWRENIFVGGSFRGVGNKSRESAALMAGAKINEKTTIGYAFDIPLAPLSNAQRGSHELLLRYTLNQPIGAGKLPPVIYNPRFF